MSDDDDRQVLAHHRLELAHGHQEAAVADHHARSSCRAAPLAMPSAAPKAKPDRGEVADHLEGAGIRNAQVGDDAQEVAAVDDEVAVLRQQLLELHARATRRSSVRRRIGGLEVRSPDGSRTRACASPGAVEGLVGGVSLAAGRRELLGHEARVADHAHVGVEPAADVGAHRYRLGSAARSAARCQSWW